MFVVNVEGAIRRGDRWLMIKRSDKEEHAPGALSFVGGKCEREEASADILERTLQREIYEEVGVNVTDLHYVNSSIFQTASGIDVIDVVYICTLQEGEAYPKSPDEVDGIKWLTTEEILAHPGIPDFLVHNIQQCEEVYRSRFT
ncbi:NUDIX domain-containing protein [Rossellomorea marisflavi]|uniref:NUDIX hydrolase n=1 Tax=Rossellomorea marisflavi TaxID=189381 RepID=UPI0006FE8930|nr:NUDIX domain-containing protein [Rossellomorea marisflavi]KQU63644.1 DNA mismatch repair protein MutT [Bacillus sp. Leaf406]MDW4525769.1 NUDIX domain-containing protein [Rossellomorea marisflavi]